jgi:phosphatidate cytidylyltransferase
MGPQPSMSAPIELPARAVSAVVMAAVAIYLAVLGGVIFACFIAIGAIAALREWHRLVNAGSVAPETIASSLAVTVAVLVASFYDQLALPLLVLALGATASLLWSASRKQAPLWHGLGPLYVGLAAVALVILRAAPSGEYLVLGIFVAVWTADTGALFGGRLIGGPKLVPRLSPNKTWAGFVAGTLAAGIAEAIYMGLVNGNAAGGLALGIAIALIGHAGDLFESWVKRRFRAKDSGGLIPGHGGVLDRIDSLLFVAPACAFLVAFPGLNPLLGAAR